MPSLAPAHHLVSSDGGTRILMVDSDSDLVRLLQVNVERYGFRMEAVGTGAEALARLDETPAPDLLLVSWVLPDLGGSGGGLVLCRNIRQFSRCAALPVVMMMCGTFEADGWYGCMDASLTKPFNPFEVVSIARRLLPRAEGA